MNNNPKDRKQAAPPPPPRKRKKSEVNVNDIHVSADTSSSRKHRDKLINDRAVNNYRFQLESEKKKTVKPAFIILALAVFGFFGSFSFPILIVIAACIGFIFNAGNKEKKGLVLVEHYRMYVSQLNANGYAPVKKLAGSVGLSEYETVRELKTMITNAWFTQPYLDIDNYVFYLDGTYYDENVKQQQAEKEAPKEDPYEEYPEAVKNILVQGDTILSELSALHPQLEGDSVLYEDLIKLENTSKQILDYIIKYPQPDDSVRKMVYHYLPLIRNALKKYLEFSDKTVSSDIVHQARLEISSALKNSSKSFENLLSDLYADASVDLHTDLNVLNNLLKQEGIYSEGEFENDKQYH